MAGAPVALDETPSSGHIDGVPRIAEAVVLEAYAWLVAGRFGIALDDNAMQTGVAALDFTTGGKKRNYSLIQCVLT
jgi:hypothetical protein